MSEAYKKQLNKEYRIAYTRRVVRNIVDRKYRLAKESMLKGIREFGPSFPFKVIRFYYSYKLRFNKLVKKMKRNLHS
jgi:hypothetical protein